MFLKLIDPKTDTKRLYPFSADHATIESHVDDFFAELRLLYPDRAHQRSNVRVIVIK